MTEPVCQAAVDLVKHFEGLRLKAYLCPAGVPTIGYGHTKGVKLGQTITPAQADKLLADDLAVAAAAVDRLVKVQIGKGQRGALSSFTFNLGAGNLGISTLLKLLNMGDYEGAAAQFGRWVNATVDGEKIQLPGLVKRREAEALLFRSNLFLTRIASADPMPQMCNAPAGAEDDEVRIIQRIVGVAVDGIYGPATAAAVKRWQKDNGLVADGIVGPKTRAAMGVS